MRDEGVDGSRIKSAYGSTRAAACCRSIIIILVVEASAVRESAQCSGGSLGHILEYTRGLGDTIIIVEYPWTQSHSIPLQYYSTRVVACTCSRVVNAA